MTGRTLRGPRVLAVLAGALLSVGAVHVAALATEPARPTYRHVLLPTHPCAQEDSRGPCYWDAGWQGNGGGHSFWVDGRQHVHYLAYGADKRWGDHPPERGSFRGWRPVPGWLQDALAEGEDGTPRGNRDWSRCAYHVGPTSVVACPDGFVSVS